MSDAMDGSRRRVTGEARAASQASLFLRDHHVLPFFSPRRSKSFLFLSYHQHRAYQMALTSPSPISVHACRWEWCRSTFESPDRLAKHVLDEHLENLVPVRRIDVPMELRAHDGGSYEGASNINFH